MYICAPSAFMYVLRPLRMKQICHTCNCYVCFPMCLVERIPVLYSGYEHLSSSDHGLYAVIDDPSGSEKQFKFCSITILYIYIYIYIYFFFFFFFSSTFTL